MQNSVFTALAPIIAPCSIAEIKQYCKVPVWFTEDDLLFARLVLTAKSVVQRLSNRFIGRHLIDEVFDVGHSNVLRFKYGPVTGIEHVWVYYNELRLYQSAGGDDFVVSMSPMEFLFYRSGDAGHMQVNINSVRNFKRLKVSYYVGTSDLASVPPELIQAVYMLVSEWYLERGNPNAVRRSAAADLLLRIQIN